MSQFRDNIETVLVKKCSSSSFLPHTPPAFQQAMLRSLTCFVHLGRAAILDHEGNNDLQDCRRAGCPCGEGGDRCEKPTSQLHTCMDGR